MRCVDAKAGADTPLVIGIAHARDFLPEEIRRGAQVEEAARAVDDALKVAGKKPMISLLNTGHSATPACGRQASTSRRT